MRIFYDTETCGFHGPITLLQWAEDDGPVQMHSPWMTSVKETMVLIEHLMWADEIVGFNLTFDHFHLCQMYTTLALMSDRNAILIDCIDEYAYNEPKARFGPCLKPKKSCDIMLHARKGPYQSTMDRGDIRVKRVPSAIVYSVARELESRVKLKDIYFSRRKDKHAPKWQVYDLIREDGSMDPDFKDIVVKFMPSSALKALAADALGVVPDDILKFVDVEPKGKPEEKGWAPYALSVGSRANWRGAWPDLIHSHTAHWSYNSLARKYAEKDVIYTRDLWEHFGRPEAGDDDSELACMVGAVRWRGFKVNGKGLEELKAKVADRRYKKDERGQRFAIPTDPAKSRVYINQVLSPIEQKFIKNSTKKILLEEMSGWWLPCEECGDDDPKKARCCKTKEKHPVNIRSREVLQARQAKYEINLFDKFIEADRFHAAFEVIGALSNRMSGSGGDLNSQGIKRDKIVREQFPLADDDFILCGGDFSAFEVGLAEACYNDPDLRADLMKGKKIHALFGVFLYRDMTYEQIVASAGTEDDFYDRSKRAFFAVLYGGEAFTLHERIGIDIEIAEEALTMFGNKYKEVGRYAQTIKDKFCSMKQIGAIGSKIVWNEPADYIESMFGYRRYFTMENTICRVLFNLANKPPKEWKNAKIVVQRRDRMQTGSGAAQSALFAAAFSIQSSNTRAARNHVIQSSGATITKRVQRNIWNVQPAGVNKWLVVPLNIHDEIECPCHPSVVEEVKRIVNETVASYKERVPFIKMDWSTHLKTWADKS